MGLKCKRCGAYEFPPMPICNECASTDMEWVEMKGTATLVSFTVMRILDDIQIKYGQRLIGQAQLEEGPAITTTIEGVGIDDAEKLYERLPLKCTLGIKQFDGFKFVSAVVKD